MLQVNFYDHAPDDLLEFAVIIAKTGGKWVFCKHKERDTYEVPGGHREPGETILDTAKRELYEEPLRRSCTAKLRKLSSANSWWRTGHTR